jgi:hypothetical protein
MTDPLTRLDQLGAPDPVGARYNRPPKDRPTASPRFPRGTTDYQVPVWDDVTKKWVPGPARAM